MAERKCAGASVHKGTPMDLTRGIVWAMIIIFIGCPSVASAGIGQSESHGAVFKPIKKPSKHKDLTPGISPVKPKSKVVKGKDLFPKLPGEKGHHHPDIHKPSKPLPKPHKH